jgi:hypothetical protein
MFELQWNFTVSFTRKSVQIRYLLNRQSKEAELQYIYGGPERILAIDWLNLGDKKNLILTDIYKLYQKFVSN